MNRRSFLQIFGAGLPAVVVAEKFGLMERVRSYFFAPKGGWGKIGDVWVRDKYDPIFHDIVPPRNLHGIPYYMDIPPTVGTFYGISRKPLPKVFLVENGEGFKEVDFDKALLIG